MVQLYGSSVQTNAEIRAHHFASRRLIVRRIGAVLLGSVLAVCALIGYATFRQNQEMTELLTYHEKNEGFDDWAHPALSEENDRSLVNSRWTYDSASPPYVTKITMYSGEGVHEDGPANYVRRLLDIKTQWRTHRWTSNNFVKDFESDQMRFLSRNQHSFLIIPPLSSMPVLSNTAAHLLNNYLLFGHNTLVICGSPSSVLFINENLPSWDLHGYELDSKWHEGPYEQQRATIGSRFDKTATVLSGPGVWGVDINSLPQEAVSYYEAPGVSVVFALPAKTGVIIYIGFEFRQQSAAWAEILQAAISGTAL